MYNEIDDQAGFMSAIAAAHLKNHGGKPDPNCDFCKGFLLPSEEQLKRLEEGYPLTSYKFIILDVSNNAE